MAIIEKLRWDSQFFRYPVGKIEIQNFNELDFQKFKKEISEYKLVYVFSKEESKSYDFHLVDKKVVYFQDNITFNKDDHLKTEIQSFDKKKHDIDQLTELALESGIYSRFNRDPHFNNNEYEKLYKEWIIKSINGVLAFDILIGVGENKILGFTTLAKKSEKIADIGLVAVHKNARGMGVGTDLIKKTLKNAALRNYSAIQVVTQADNLPAVNLYTRNNFILKEKTNIYHFWNL